MGIKEIFAEKRKVSLKKIADKPSIGLVNGLYATSSGVGGLTIIEAFKLTLKFNPIINDKKSILETFLLFSDKFFKACGVLYIKAINNDNTDLEKYHSLEGDEFIEMVTYISNRVLEILKDNINE